jgi:hypothetical protein
MILDANGPTLVVSDEVDENGVVEFAIENNDAKKLVYAALTVNQAKELAYHLLGITHTKETKVKVEVGSVVRVSSTNTVFFGQTGVVVERHENYVKDFSVALTESGTYAFEASELEVM